MSFNKSLERYRRQRTTTPACLERARGLLKGAWHAQPLESYSEGLCVLGLRLGLSLKICHCARPSKKDGQTGHHSTHGSNSSSVAPPAPATVARIRNLTANDWILWTAARERFRRDKEALAAAGC